jgi:phage-related minor tail protein
MGVQIADVYARMLLDDKGFQKDIQGSAETAGDKAGKTLGQRIKSGLSATKIGAGLGAAFGAVGLAGINMGTQVDSAYDSIRVGTGATGEALKGLEGDFKAVAGTVTDDMGTVGQVLADLNTRTGATGDELQGLTKKVLDLSRITGTDAVSNVASLTRVFGDWSIATEDQEATLDALFRASQSTGIGVDQLGASVVQFGAPLRQVGFTFEESIGLLGKFEKEGVNSELVMGSLRIALGKMASENAKVSDLQAKQTEQQKAYNKAVKKYGEDSEEARKAQASLAKTTTDLDSAMASADVPKKLQDQIAAIKAAGTAGEANALALELFGSRAGPDMAAAIREGRFDLGELFSTISDGSETVDKAVSDTDSAGDVLKRAINGIKVGFGDLFTATAGVGEALGPMIYLLPAATSGLGALAGKAVGAAGSLGTKLLPAITTSLIPALAGLAPAIGGGLTAMFSGAVAILGAAIPVIMAALPFIIVGAIVAAIAILILNPEIRDEVFGFVGGILEWIGDALGGLLQVVGDAFAGAFAVVGDILGQIGSLIGQAIQLWIDYVLLFPIRVLEAFTAILGVIADFVAQAVPKVAAFIGQVVGFFLSIPGKVAGLIGQIVGIFARLGGQVLSGIVGLVGKIVGTILGIPGKIVGLIGDFADVARRAVQAFMGFILDLPGKVAGVLGDIAGNIGDAIGGLIPHFATGAETVPYTGLAMVHQGEMIVPASTAEQVRSGQAMIDYAPEKQQRGGTSVNVTVHNPKAEPASTSVVREMRKLAYMGVVG